MDNPEQLPTVISFCSGYAGIERGLDLAGFRHRVVAYVEIEAFAIANLVAKMEAGELDSAPIWTNLKTFPAHLFRDRVDLITGGYPCQPFSAAGNRKGADDPRHLWPFIRRHVQTIRPTRCLFENVEGHISLGLSSVISDLEEDGYAAAWGIFSAEEVGAPHQRKRVYILADASGRRFGCEGKGQIQQSRRAEAVRTSKTVELGNSTDSGCDRRPVPAQRTGPESISQQSPQNPLTKATGSGAALADRHSQRELQPQGAESVERGRVGDSSEELADPQGVGVQRLRAGGKQKPHSHGQEILPVREGERPGGACWDAEPNVGRVVDGCPDRVDRIRLLGNGVVPQTAAKAWITLTEPTQPGGNEQSLH
ncbi:DNA cytosine methyltransferase [Porticoccaceae bacterium]|nr:DNA cytosine methyltransferase [Porticoccaceae bacterium]